MNTTILIDDIIIELSQDTLTYAYGARSLSYLSTACFAWLLWDWIINFEVEHRLIWKKRKTAASALYLFLRFWSCFLQGFILLMYDVRWTTLTSNFCEGLKWVICIGSFVQIIVLQVLLQGRVYAIYECRKTILYTNLAVSILSAAGFAVAAAFQIPKMASTTVGRPLFGCWSEISREIVFVFVPLASYDLWLWFLVIFKAFNRSQGRLTLSSYFKLDPEAILLVLLRDSTFWFTASVILWLIILLILVYAPIGLHCAGIPIFLTATCIGGCRLVMNVRRAYYYPGDDEDAAEVGGCAERRDEETEGTFRFASRSLLDEMELGQPTGSQGFHETDTVELRVFAPTSPPRNPSGSRTPDFDPTWDSYRNVWVTEEKSTQRGEEEDEQHVEVTRKTDERRSSWRRPLGSWGAADTSTSGFSPPPSSPIEIWVKEVHEINVAGPS